MSADGIDHEPAVGTGAPFFDDLRVGMIDVSAPPVTLTSGLAAIHQAIVGDRLALALDATLARRVLPSGEPLAHPALVWDVAIGQSTTVTRRVIANLFYRGLVLRRSPSIGDTLSSSTEVVALRRTTARTGRPATGLAVLRIRTTDQAGHVVLDFWRCAMLPLRDPEARTVHDDSLERFPAGLDGTVLRAALAGWNLEALGSALRAGRGDVAGAKRAREMKPGERVAVHGGDVVSAAPELARLSLNIAAVHHDGGTDGRRLVYGGHTIGIAAAQLTRTLQGVATIVAWRSCDHLAPVYEGDTLSSEIELAGIEEIGAGMALASLRSRVDALRGSERHAVLDWKLVAVVA
ncbi:MAG: hotdog family protein [Solirubrobacteraceae bacterium]